MSCSPISLSLCLYPPWSVDRCTGCIGITNCTFELMIRKQSMEFMKTATANPYDGADFTVNLICIPRESCTHHSKLQTAAQWEQEQAMTRSSTATRRIMMCRSILCVVLMWLCGEWFVQVRRRRTRVMSDENQIINCHSYMSIVCVRDRENALHSLVVVCG